MSHDSRSCTHGQPRRLLGELERVVFELEANSWHGFATERLWAERVGPGVYRILNVPFFAKDVSHEDIVSARVEGSALVFAAIVTRGGHSTYRVLIENGPHNPRFKLRWRALEELGCTYEFTARLVAVDVPPSTHVHDVYKLLAAGEADGDWEFEEGHCGHAV